MFQYTVELPPEIAGLEKPLSTLELTRWLQALYAHLENLYQELAETTRPDGLNAACRALAQQLEGHQRKLSTEYQRFEDL